MFSFFSSSPPNWANFLTGKEYQRFITLVHEYFKRRQLTISEKDGIIQVAENVFGMNQLGLVNLAQQCKLHSDADWREIIDDHFKGMIKAREFDIEFEKNKHDYSYVKEYISVRLYPQNYFDAVGSENVIARPFADSIIEVLIFDMPQSISNVKPVEASKWDIDREELFQLGFNNVRNRYPAQISKERFSNFEIWFCQADHLFATNLALDHTAMQKYCGSKGALVGLPHRHAMLIYPIENVEVVTAINTLIPVIAGMNNEGPGSISANLFWYENSQYKQLPYELADKKLSFRPPNDFVEMIQTLRS